MAYYDVNGEKDYIFGKDGGKELAKTLQTNFFGEIPLEKSIREGADNGKPVASQGDDKYIKLFESIVEKIDQLNN